MWRDEKNINNGEVAGRRPGEESWLTDPPAGGGRWVKGGGGGGGESRRQTERGGGVRGRGRGGEDVQP